MIAFIQGRRACRVEMHRQQQMHTSPRCHIDREARRSGITMGNCCCRRPAAAEGPELHAAQQHEPGRRRGDQSTGCQYLLGEGANRAGVRCTTRRTCCRLRTLCAPLAVGSPPGSSRCLLSPTTTVRDDIDLSADSQLCCWLYPPMPNAAGAHSTTVPSRRGSAACLQPRGQSAQLHIKSVSCGCRKPSI